MVDGGTQTSSKGGHQHFLPSVTRFYPPSILTLQIADASSVRGTSVNCSASHHPIVRSLTGMLFYVIARRATTPSRSLVQIKVVSIFIICSNMFRGNSLSSPKLCAINQKLTEYVKYGATVLD